MTLQERKDKVDILSKRSDIINKKAILLLAISGGIGAYSIRFLFDTENLILGYLFAGVFIITSIGVFVNYIKLHKIEKRIEELENV